jgi:hypothetical protein
VKCLEFFARVLRLRLTIGQTAFVAVAIDGVLPRDLEGAVRDAALELFGDIVEIPSLARRTVVAAMGRDSGKTQLAAGVALYKLVTCDLSRLGPGDVGTAAVVAPREKTARIALRRAIALVRRAPELRKRLVGDPRKDGFTLRRPDGHDVTFETFAASKGGASLRGPSFIAVIFDEAAQFRDESAAVNDEELYAAVMPRVLPDGLALFLSTPWAEEGLFWKLANENHAAPGRALIAKAPTLIMRDNDPVIAEQVAAEYERDPDNAAREFGAEFMASGGSLFFDGKSLTDAIDESLVLPVPPLGGESVGCGADVGLVRDSSAIVAVGARGVTNELLRVLDIVEKRPEKNKPLLLSEVVHAFADVCRGYGVTSFVADGYAREPAREHAQKEKITIIARPEHASQRTKDPNVPGGPAAAKFETYAALRNAFMDRRIAIPKHSRLLAQLRAITSRPKTGGLYEIKSPRRIGQAHGDLVSALVLGAWQARRSSPGRFTTATFGESRYAIGSTDDDNPEARGLHWPS